MNYLITADGTADRTRQREEITERHSCELCGDTFTVPCRRVKAHYSNDLFTIARCNRCGLLFVDPRLSGAFRAFCYRNETHLVDWFLRGKAEGVRHAVTVLDLLALAGCRGGDLLEVGCGIGTFLDVARDRGFATIGIEVNEGTARYAAQSHRIVRGDFDDVALPSSSCDVLAMEQTLEHMARPLATLKKAWQLLRPGGYLYIGVPQVDWLRLSLDRLSGEVRPPGSLWSPEDHLFYYTPAVMRRFLTSARFRLVPPPLRKPKLAVRRLLGLSSGHFVARKAV